MLFTPQEAFSILEHYKYIVIFPITVIEGPIITVIGGFLAYLGYLNFYVAIFFLALGDWVGDGLHWVLGRYYSGATWFKKFGKFWGYDEKREIVIVEHFKKHPGKTVILAKVSHGVGGFIQIAAGMAKMDFWEFMKFSLIGTIPKTALLFFIGYFLGNSYEKINTYMNRVAYIVLFFAIFICIYFMVKKVVNKKVIE
jgi:membrane protein DedA with SNARE-associated domain